MSGLAGTTFGEAGPRVVLLHGLFGQGRNFTAVAKALSTTARVTILDLPDHGRSPWSTTFSYEAVADAVADHLAELAPGETWTVVGHSMGGKVAMLVALRHPALVARLAVVDIAPGTSTAVTSFGTYVDALRAVDLDGLTERSQADRTVAERVPDRAVRGFLLQNLRRDATGGPGGTARWRWQMNLRLLGDRLDDIAGWPEGDLGTYAGPVLWVAGADSAYVQPEAEPAMRALFPRVRVIRVKGAGHWVHADQPEVFVATLRHFLQAP